MPAPQASMMQQKARKKFTDFGLTVPTNWKDPSGDPDAGHYGKAFTDSEKSTSPGSPPLFKAATPNKYHTDTQKMHIDKVGKFIDGTCSAICSAWSQWQSAAKFSGAVITGPMAVGGLLAPIVPFIPPLIMATAPKSTPAEMKYSTVISTVIATQWTMFTVGFTLAKPTSWYPSFAAQPTVAIPAANLSFPGMMSDLILPPTEQLISANTLKGLMIAQLGDPMAPFNKELFESIATAFEECYKDWKTQTTIVGAMGVGGCPTCVPPAMVPGPVIGAIPPPGGSLV